MMKSKSTTSTSYLLEFMEGADIKMKKKENLLYWGKI